MSEHRDAPFGEALDSVRARIAEGAPREAALQGVPEGLRAEIEASLQPLSRVERMRSEPSPAFAAGLEARLLTAVESARAAQGRRRWSQGSATSLMLRVSGALAAVALLFGGTGVAAVQASMSAIPGDPLYRVKEAREAFELFVARGPRSDVRARETQLARRERELEAAMARGVSPRTLAALERRVGGAVEDLVRLSLRLEAAGDDQAAERAARSLVELRARVDALARSADSPEAARALRRISRFLDAQVRLLEGSGPAGAPR